VLASLHGTRQLANLHMLSGYRGHWSKFRFVFMELTDARDIGHICRLLAWALVISKCDSAIMLVIVDLFVGHMLKAIRGSLSR